MSSLPPFKNMLSRFGAQRTLFSILLVFCFVAIFASLRTFPQSPSQPPPSTPIPAAYTPSKEPTGSDSLCKGQRAPPDTVIIVKTGANEIYDKVPTQLLTVLRCYDDILFFSDLGNKLGPYTVHDALENVTESVKAEAPEFQYYRTLHEYQKNGQDVGELRKISGKAAWNLDKYKFLHMLEQSWKMRPNKKWYFFIEADTYVIQRNLRLWLERLDSSQSLYFGSPTSANGYSFSHGGSGVLLSGPALAKFADGDEGIASRYDDRMMHEGFGDLMLTVALKEKGVNFSPVWPMLQAEKPSTLPFGNGPDSGVRHWCQPFITMHHINPDDASRIWNLEQKFPDVSKPLLIKDIYEGLVASEIHPKREDWWNLSDDQYYRGPGINLDRQKSPSEMSELEKEAYLSFEHCRKACEEQTRCYQFVYFDQTCGFSFSYRLGAKREPNDGTFYASGWDVAKIQRDAANNPCSSPKWIPA